MEKMVIFVPHDILDSRQRILDEPTVQSDQLVARFAGAPAGFHFSDPESGLGDIEMLKNLIAIIYKFLKYSFRECCFPFQKELALFLCVERVFKCYAKYSMIRDGVIVVCYIYCARISGRILGNKGYAFV